ncbi:MAG: 3-phosphoshikimate 1-carboxyvinyltransferase [Planctomycetota bacterium]|nr:MAG: 3-phosphoshikimate 1-carboxyvinyltransferase [Planctomycetota bacterium]
MQPLTLTPLGRPLDWTWPIPGSKSLTNRALPLAALASGESRLRRVLHSIDTQAMRHCLQAWGVDIREAGEDLLVNGGRDRLRPSQRALEVENSGTTVRFLSAMAALVPGDTTLCGDADMAKRPIADLVNALGQLGIQVDCASGCPPLTVRGQARLRGHTRIPGNRSSQYLSALLIAGAADPEGISVSIEGSLVSAPYARMTLDMIQAFGGQVDEDPGQRYASRGPLRGANIAIEPDASAASYAFAAAVATGGRVRVEGLGRGSAQGDLAFVDILEAMGARVERAEDATTVIAGPKLRGVDVDMHHISDTVMTLAAIAPLAKGPTTIRNVANIRIKETDRLSATVSELRRLGQQVEHGEDWLRITPAPLRAASIECYRDHRMAMSFAVLGMAKPGLTISDPACVAKTYPAFWQHLAQCYRHHNQDASWAD